MKRHVFQLIQAVLYLIICINQWILNLFYKMMDLSKTFRTSYQQQ